MHNPCVALRCNVTVAVSNHQHFNPLVSFIIYERFIWCLSYCVTILFFLYNWSSSFIKNPYQIHFISHDSNLFPDIKGSFQEKWQIVTIADLQPSALEAHRPCCNRSFLCASVSLCPLCFQVYRRHLSRGLLTTLLKLLPPVIVFPLRLHKWLRVKRANIRENWVASNMPKWIWTPIMQSIFFVNEELHMADLP